MKEVTLYRAVMITTSENLVLRTSEKRELIIEFLKDYIHQYIKDIYGWHNVELVRGRDCYTALRKDTKNFLCCWLCSNVPHIVDGEEETEEIEETAENL